MKEENYNSYCEGCKKLIPNEHFDCVRTGVEEKKGENWRKGYQAGVEETKTRMAEMLEEIPEKEPERESDEFDAGMQEMKSRVITRIKNEI